jgi:uncharacterized ion transporter superfamily protein YfcC
LLIALVAAGTWVVPAGQYDHVENVMLGKEVPVLGTYQQVDSNPQGVVDVFLAPVAGFYNPDSYEATAIDVALFVLIIGRFLGVVTKTGAIYTGISHAMVKLTGHEKWATSQQRGIKSINPADLANYDFATGSMGPKANAAQ